MATSTKKTSDTDVVIGAAAASFNKAAANLNDAVKAISGLVESSEHLSLEIAAKESKAAELDNTYLAKSRQAEVDFILSFQEKKDATVNEYLKSVGKQAVVSSEYAELQSAYAKSVAEKNAEVTKAVGAENARLTREYMSEKALLESKFETSAAQQTAQLESLQRENLNLRAQVNQLFGQIDAERSAGIERAKASAIGSVNVGTPNSR